MLYLQGKDVITAAYEALGVNKDTYKKLVEEGVAGKLSKGLNEEIIDALNNKLPNRNLGL